MDRAVEGDYLRNLWFGVSITNQQDAGERIPWLLKTPAAHRWLSIEPLLQGHIKLWPWLPIESGSGYDTPFEEAVWQRCSEDTLKARPEF